MGLLLHLMLSAVSLYPQVREVTDSTITLNLNKTVVVNAEYARQPVRSMKIATSHVVDTMDTLNEDVKVVLYADNSWQYIRIPGFVRDQRVFDEHWETTTPNPYQKQMSDLPLAWAIWLVDSLDHYHCPYQGSVYPRGKYGMRRGRPHQGVDLPLQVGDKIYSPFPGKVRVSRYSKGYGNLVIVRHENGIETFYGHLSDRKVEVGDWVDAGTVIGLGGSTGRSTGPHLHFETRYQGFSFDPQWLIDFKTGELRHRLFILKKKFFSQYSCYEQNFEDELKNEEEDKKEDAEREAMRWYTIKSGDTLSGIAYRNGTSVSALCRLNGITANSILKIGRTIRVR